MKYKALCQWRQAKGCFNDCVPEIAHEYILCYKDTHEKKTDLQLQSTLHAVIYIYIYKKRIEEDLNHILSSALKHLVIKK